MAKALKNAAKTTKANKGATKAPKGTATNDVDVPSLIKALQKANAEGDRQMGKKIRRKLRAAGHRGGLRGQGGDNE